MTGEGESVQGEKSKSLLVSVIIPVYQVSAYVERCLLSVMNQTYQSIECIIVDDCSIDDSIAKCERLIESYQGPIKFKILHHERNRGLSAARNTGTKAATGDYLYYLDSDDEITPDCLEKLVTIAQKYPEAEIVHGNSIMIPADKRVKIHLDKRLPDLLVNNKDISVCYHKHWIPTSAWNKLIKRTFIIDNGLFFKEGVIYEDLLWMFFVVKHLSCVCFCRDITYHYYMREGSIVNSTKCKVEGDSFLLIYNTILNNLTPSHKQIELNGYVEGFCKRYLKYRKLVPMFEVLYLLYIEKTRQYKCRRSYLKLKAAKMMTRIPKGDCILQTMKDVKTLITG